MNIVSPKLSVGLTTTGASPTHAIHSVSSTRCGFSFAPIGRASVRPSLVPRTSYLVPLTSLRRIFVFFAKKIVIFGRNLQRNN